uniref:Putative translation initiation factor-3 translation initiation factor-3 n=1 Tax=Amblyomma triste TaxID=251400 RepID=A0A023G5S6_AMBTT
MSLARHLVVRLRTCFALHTTHITCAIQPKSFGQAPPQVPAGSLMSIREYCKGATKSEKEKTEFVLLINTDDRILGTKTKDEALAFAKKHDCHLVQVEDSRHAEAKKRKIYKIMTPQQMFDHEERQTNAAGAKRDSTAAKQHLVKNVIASSKITENDLNTKLKGIKKWLDKKCEIRVGITGTPESTKQLELIYEKFENYLAGEARFLQKRITNGVLKFVIMPPSEKKNSQKSQPSKQQEASEE